MSFEYLRSLLDIPNEAWKLSFVGWLNGLWIDLVSIIFAEGGALFFLDIFWPMREVCSFLNRRSGVPFCLPNPVIYLLSFRWLEWRNLLLIK